MLYRVLGFTLAALLFAADIYAQTIDSAIDDFRRGRMEECIITLNDLVAQKTLSDDQQVTAFKYLSLASRGLDKNNEAAFYLQQLAAAAPETDLASERFPEDLLATWWRVKRAVASDTNLPQTKTIAFLHFDNASIEEADKWQPMTIGLPAMLAGDFLDLNVLKVVERAKIESILSELKLSEQQYADPHTAVRLGRLVGAHVLVFGTIMQLNSRTMRIDARLVQTETGELLAAVKVEGRPNDIVGLERELVEKLTERMELKLDEASRAKFKGPEGPPIEATLAYYNGILYEDQGNYAQAYEAYKRAAELYPPYEAAKEKLATLTPFVQAG